MGPSKNPNERPGPGGGGAYGAAAAGLNHGAREICQWVHLVHPQERLETMSSNHKESNHENPPEKVSIYVDDMTIKTNPGANLLQVCLENGIYIPNLCFLPEDGLPVASCRLCLVELGGMKSPVPSCTVDVTEGLEVRTGTDRVRNLQRSALRLLLSNHKVACADCIANKRCQLQHIAGFLKMGLNRGNLACLVDESQKEEYHPFLKHYPDRCVLCGRCVRVCTRLSGRPDFFFAGRGLASRISFFGAEKTAADECRSCKACAAACPVGALEARSDFEARAVKEP